MLSKKELCIVLLLGVAIIAGSYAMTTLSEAVGYKRGYTDGQDSILMQEAEGKEVLRTMGVCEWIDWVEAQNQCERSE